MRDPIVHARVKSWLVALSLVLVSPASAAVSQAGAEAEAGAGVEAGAEVAVDEPATRATAKVLDRLERIHVGLRETVYQHHTVVRASDGYYAWDCSGMANWILRRVAPRAYAAIGRERPVARSYWKAIDRAPSAHPRRGWQRIADIDDVRPGDVFAWRRPSHWPKGGNTGHVGFVLQAPQPVEEIEGAYTVRVADATSLPHQDDSREREGDGGFGHGTLMFVTDETGAIWAYGWFGTNSRGVIPTDIVFGRPYA
jgi:hypothetical protein